MRRRDHEVLRLLPLALLAACATAPAPEPVAPFSPYRLAAPVPQRAPGRDSAPEASRAAETLADPPAGRALNAALFRFAIDQRNARAMTPERSAAPAEVLQGWAGLLAAVDAFLAFPPERTAPLDVVRARVALDAELDFDSTWYSGVTGDLAAAVHARVLALESRISAVRRRAGPQGEPSLLLWPIEPVIVTSLFGDRTDPFSGEGQTHLGVDLKAEKGQVVTAAAAGVVTWAGRKGGHGLHVELTHPSGAVTGYSHLSLLLVQAGMLVPARGPLGLAGSTGRSTGPHLHFEVWKEGEPVDPLSELPESGRARAGRSEHRLRRRATAARAAGPR